MSSISNTANAIDNAALSKAHWKAWFLSAMGIFLDGFDLFIIAVALPLIIREYHPSALTLGLIAAAAPMGCVLGATVFGRFTDKFGRKAVMLVDLIFYVVFTALSAFSWSVPILVLFRFLLGIGIGADYPASSTYISENMPKKARGRMLVSGFGFQALGMLSAALVGAIILAFIPDVHAWRWMLGIAVVPAIIVFLLRLTLPESPRWLLHQGKTDKAEQVASQMTGKKLKVDALRAARRSSFLDLFHPRYIKRTVLTAGAWFIMDVAFYGVHFFVPIILAAMAFTSHGNYIQRDVAATHAAVFIDIFLIIGIALAIKLVDKWGRIRLQTMGFLGMALGLFILAASELFIGTQVHLVFIFVGFILFNIMVNMGPNPITFLLPSEVFPTHLRATGHGFAAGCAKAGAVLGSFMIPYLMFKIGLPATLIILGVACVAGFILTATLGYETKGRSLTELDQIDKQMDSAELNLIKVHNDIKRLSDNLKDVEGALTTALSQIRKAKPEDMGNR